MTDEQIIKALECCVAETEDACAICPLHNDRWCTSTRENATLALINRQKEEIERLKTPMFVIESKPLSKKELREALKLAPLGVIIEGETTIKRIDEDGIKAEAVKEFAEVLFNHYAQAKPSGMDKPEIVLFLTEAQLYELVKEFTERKET